MNPYVGKTCPYCKGIISESDDIVICSKCEMPHHKDCWIDNQGCTTFGCNGTIQNIPSVAPEMFDTSADDDFDIEMYGGDTDFSASYCPKCGSAHNQNDRFCGHCGYDFSTFKDINTTKPVQEPAKVSQPTYATYSSNMTNNTVNNVQQSVYGQNASIQNNQYGYHSFDEYVEKNISYYAENKSVSLQTGKSPFNFGAFWFGGYWYAYRKMFGKGLLFALITEAVCLLGWIGVIIAIGIKIFIGTSATREYISKIEGYQQTEKNLNGISKEDFYKKHKGTNFGFPFLVGLIIAVIGGFITVILGQ